MAIRRPCMQGKKWRHCDRLDDELTRKHCNCGHRRTHCTYASNVGREGDPRGLKINSHDEKLEQRGIGIVTFLDGSGLQRVLVRRRRG